MSEHLTPILIASWPLPDALSTARHELRTPLVSMHGSLQLIIRFCPAAAAELLIPSLLDQVNSLFDQVDNLFKLHIAMTRPFSPSKASDEPSASVNQPIPIFNAQITQLREDTAALHQLAQPAYVNGPLALTEDAQKLWAVFVTSQTRWQYYIDDILDAVVERLRETEQ